MHQVLRFCQRPLRSNGPAEAGRYVLEPRRLFGASDGFSKAGAVPSRHSDRPARGAKRRDLCSLCSRRRSSVTDAERRHEDDVSDARANLAPIPNGLVDEDERLEVARRFGANVTLSTSL